MKLEPKPAVVVADDSRANAESPPTPFQAAWRVFRARIVSGLVLVLPLAITLWLVHWLYSSLEKRVIDPLALWVIWYFEGQNDAQLPFWFETYAAPLIAVAVVALLLFCLGFFIHTRLHRFIDRVVARLPVISGIYDGLQKVFQVLDKKKEGQQRPQRVVLVPFPHPGMKVPAFVTGSSRDIETQKVILCVYVPTTPVPTSGYFLMIPEDDVTELNWTTDQALQSIISAGLTAPPDVSYFKKSLASHLDAAMTK